MISCIFNDKHWKGKFLFKTNPIFSTGSNVSLPSSSSQALAHSMSCEIEMDIIDTIVSYDKIVKEAVKYMEAFEWYEKYKLLLVCCWTLCVEKIHFNWIHFPFLKLKNKKETDFDKPFNSDVLPSKRFKLLMIWKLWRSKKNALHDQFSMRWNIHTVKCVL